MPQVLNGGQILKYLKGGLMNDIIAEKILNEKISFITILSSPHILGFTDENDFIYKFSLMIITMSVFYNHNIDNVLRYNRHRRNKYLNQLLWGWCEYIMYTIRKLDINVNPPKGIYKEAIEIAFDINQGIVNNKE